MVKKMIPDYCFKSIYEIPFTKLYEDGIRLILTDLDNTLISYKETMPNEKLFELKETIQRLGFELIIVSNSRKERVDNFSKKFDVPYVKFSTKPLKRGIKKAIYKVAKASYNRNEIILLGDQIMTDILGANRCKIKSCLIHPIDKATDISTTKFNRKLEKFFLKRIKRKYPEEYNNKLKEFGGN
ncbi:MAG: YqeG family HAD IIIA-type phosphatase [Anaeroplasma sp.]